MNKQSVRVVFYTLLFGLAVLLSGMSFPASAHAAAARQQHTSIATHAAMANTCPTLSSGSTGTAVITLQNKLNFLYENFSDPRWFLDSPKDFGPFTQDPSHPLQVDGDFGGHTFNAVWDYQSWNGLQVDGVVGPQTWASLGGC